MKASVPRGPEHMSHTFVSAWTGKAEKNQTSASRLRCSGNPLTQYRLNRARFNASKNVTDSPLLPWPQALAHQSHISPPAPKAFRSEAIPEPPAYELSHPRRLTPRPPRHPGHPRHNGPRP